MPFLEPECLNGQNMDPLGNVYLNMMLVIVHAFTFSMSAVQSVGVAPLRRSFGQRGVTGVEFEFPQETLESSKICTGLSTLNVRFNQQG